MGLTGYLHTINLRMFFSWSMLYKTTMKTHSKPAATLKYPARDNERLQLCITAYVTRPLYLQI